MPRRLKDWPSRFDAVLRAARRQPFAWGVHDCCLWAADAVLACTGADPAAAVRGTYADALAAWRLVEQFGGMQAIGAAAGPEISPRLAAAGDVGLATMAQGDQTDEQAAREALVVHSGQVWLAAATQGLKIVPAAAVAYAWKVGG